MVAAFKVARHDVASSSPAFRITAARSSHGQRDHSCRASAAAAMAWSTCFSDALWQSASTCAWSCGMTAVKVSPVVTGFPPMTSGMSILSAAIAFSRAFSSARSGEPGA